VARKERSQKGANKSVDESFGEKDVDI